MPSICGVASTSLVLCIFFNPSAFSVSFWRYGRSMLLFTWVILIFFI
jgi:hypothetical protein